MSEPTPRPRRWWAAGLFGLLAPGLGQVYNGQARKGLLGYGLHLASMLLIAALVVAPVPGWTAVGMVALPLAVRLWLFGDGIVVARRLRDGYTLKRYNRWYVYLGLVLATWLGTRLFIWPVRTFVAQAIEFPSSSMEPTILIGDRLLIDRWTFRSREPERGDLVIFVSMENNALQLLKRVVGIPGDRLEIRDKRLFANGEEAVEPYAVHQDPTTFLVGSTIRRDNFGPFEVPAGHLFVLGDNRDNSNDSRFWGPLSRRNVVGGGRMVIYWSWDAEAGRVRWERIGRVVR